MEAVWMRRAEQWRRGFNGRAFSLRSSRSKGRGYDESNIKSVLGRGVRHSRSDRPHFPDAERYPQEPFVERTASPPLERCGDDRRDG